MKERDMDIAMAFGWDTLGWTLLVIWVIGFPEAWKLFSFHSTKKRIIRTIFWPILLALWVVVALFCGGVQ